MDQPPAAREVGSKHALVACVIFIKCEESGGNETPSFSIPVGVPLVEKFQKPSGSQGSRVFLPCFLKFSEN